MAAYTVDQLTAVGGNLWEKGDARRVYFNDIPELLGWEYGRYHTGNVSWVRQPDGERGSNGRFQRWLVGLNRAALFYDLNAGKFSGRLAGEAFTQTDFEACVAAIKRRVRALVTA